MKRIFFFFLFFLSGFSICNAQVWLWLKDFNCSEDSWPVATDISGNVYMTITESCSFGSVSTSHRCGLYKIDRNGSPISAICSNNNYTFPSAVCTDSKGNVFLSGKFGDTTKFGSIGITSSGSNSFLVKFDSNETPKWIKASSNKASDCFVQPNAMTCDTKGNIIITGYFFDTIAFDSFVLTDTHLQDSGFIVKYNSTGNVIWAYKVGPMGTSVTTDSIGSIYVVGDNYFTKLDSNGQYKWSVSGVFPHVFEWNTFNSVISDKSNNIYVAGEYHDTVIFGNDTLRALKGGYTGYILKYNANGQLIWTKNFKSSHTQTETVIVDQWNNIYVAGGVFDTLSVDSVTMIPFKPNGDDSYIFKFDSSGHILCYNLQNGGGDDEIGLAIDPLGPNVYFCSDAIYYDTVAFGRDTIYNPNEGSLNEYPIIAKWTCNNIEGISAVVGKKETEILFPNPNNGRFTIESSVVSAKSIVEIYNMLGEKIYSQVMPQTPKGALITIDLGSKSSGVYLYRIVSETGTQIANGKFVIE
jgi:hypothetical protein